MVLLQVAGATLALRQEDVAELVAAPRVEPLPGASPGLLGLTAQRGEVVAVHDAGGLLGLGAVRAPARMLARLAVDPSLGLAFDGFVGLRQVAAESEPGPGDSPFLDLLPTGASQVLRVLRVSSLVTAMIAPGRRGSRGDLG
jgi:hypothetical protein